MNTIDQFEKIINLAKEKGLCEEYLVEASEPLDFIGKLTSTSYIQTTIFAIILERFGDYQVSIDEIADALKCSRIRFIQYMDDIDVLKKKRLIREITTNRDHRRDNVVNFTIPLDVVNSIRKGIEYKAKSIENLKPQEFYDYADDLFTAAIEEDIETTSLFEEINELIAFNENINFVKKKKEYNLCDNSSIILLSLCSALVSRNDEKIETSDLSNIIGNSAFRNFIREFKQKEHELSKNELMNFDFHRGLFDTEYCLLSQKAKDEFLVDVKLVEKENFKSKYLIAVDKLPVKELYYNKKTRSSIHELTTLLFDGNFQNVQVRLSENNLRTGFACIFSGPPGTGKTETVYQMAKKTGRDIMFVDISETKSCWFGESEKLIKDLFAQYRKMVENGGIIPILLFNEADAVLGKRQEISNTSGSVDQTENAIQNIILQEMEDLKGILIATTNMTANFDKAFERRFLYKIEFDKPDIESKD